MNNLPEVLRVNPDGVRHLCTEIFCAAGYPRENAEFIANSLVFADIRGVSSHGPAVQSAGRAASGSRCNTGICGDRTSCGLHLCHV